MGLVQRKEDLVLLDFTVIEDSVLRRLLVHCGGT